MEWFNPRATHPPGRGSNRVGAISRIRFGVPANALTVSKKARQNRMLFET